MRLNSRVARLEARRTPQDATDGALWTLADWLAQSEARRGLTPAERLAARLRDDLNRLPTEKRATMARLWTQAAEVETLLELWEGER